MEDAENLSYAITPKLLGRILRFAADALFLTPQYILKVIPKSTRPKSNNHKSNTFLVLTKCQEQSKYIALINPFHFPNNAIR